MCVYICTVVHNVCVCLLVCVCFCSRPTVTGSSVLGVTFSGGVMLAADTLGKGEREGEGGEREREREREMERKRERD